MKSKQLSTVIAAMLSQPLKAWWRADDFMRSGSEHFVGWEASARMSDLKKKYPAMIESRRGTGEADDYPARFRLIRIRYENIEQFWSDLPEDLLQLFEAADIRPAAIEI